MANLLARDIRDVIRDRMADKIARQRLEIERLRSQQLASLKERKARVEFLIGAFESAQSCSN
jgi:hypothetical protein